jgi:hypothetical protein
MQHRLHMGRNGLYFCLQISLRSRNVFKELQCAAYVWCYFYTGVVFNIHVSYLVESFQLKAEPAYPVENNVLC